MTPTRYFEILARLGWTPAGLARQLGRSGNTVANWTRPGYRVPADVAAWLERRLAAHERWMRDDPPPGS